MPITPVDDWSSSGKVKRQNNLFFIFLGRAINYAQGMSDTLSPFESEDAR